MKRRIYDYDDEAPDVIPDGSGVRVPAFLMDSDRRRATIADAIREDCRVFSGHRPMPIQDMQFAVRMSVSDAERLAGAMAGREQAFDELCKRSSEAWRRPFADAAKPLNALPEPNEDQRDPDEDNNGDNNNNERVDLEEAITARDRARLERDRLGEQKWRTAGITDPAEADRVMRQAAQWRHGT